MHHSDPEGYQTGAVTTRRFIVFLVVLNRGCTAGLGGKYAHLIIARRVSSGTQVESALPYTRSDTGSKGLN